MIPVDLNALAWLEDYLQTWPGTLLVVCVLSSPARPINSLRPIDPTIVHFCECSYPLSITQFLRSFPGQGCCRNWYCTSTFWPSRLLQGVGIHPSTVYYAVSDPLLPFTEISLSSTPLNLSGIVTYARSTTPSWITGSIYKRLLTDGDITLTVVRAIGSLWSRTFLTPLFDTSSGPGAI